MRAVVIGGNGQLGSDVVADFTAAGHSVLSLAHSEIEIGNLESVRDALERAGPEVVVNTAAMHNVEACERDPEQAHVVNGLGPRNLSRVCADLGAALLHISTDYVFGGEKRTPYVETDIPRPVNVYGESKLAGERHVLDGPALGAVVRTSALYGASPCRAKRGENFVRLMLRLGAERGEVKVVSDEFVSPTYTVDLASQLRALAMARADGLFHATSQGEVSWKEFAVAIFEEAELRVTVTSATSADFPSKVPRPAYSVLDNRELRQRGLDVMPPWRDALRRYVGMIAPRHSAAG